MGFTKTRKTLTTKRHVRRCKKAKSKSKKQRTIFKGGLYPNGARRDDGSLITREEYITNLKTIGLTDDIISSIEGDKNYSRDGIDHSLEYPGQILMRFKETLGARLMQCFDEMKKIVLNVDGTCKNIRDIPQDKKKELNKYTTICKLALERIQTQIISEDTILRRNDRVKVMSVYNLNDLCETLRKSTNTYLTPETINEIVIIYLRVYFQQVRITPRLNIFLIECLQGRPIDPSSFDIRDFDGDLVVSTDL
jgi:hypothetical protein